MERVMEKIIYCIVIKLKLLFCKGPLLNVKTLSTLILTGHYHFQFK